MRVRTLYNGSRQMATGNFRGDPRLFPTEVRRNLGLAHIISTPFFTGTLRAIYKHRYALRIVGRDWQTWPAHADASSNTYMRVCKATHLRTQKHGTTDTNTHPLTHSQHPTCTFFYVLMFVRFLFLRYIHERTIFNQMPTHLLRPFYQWKGTDWCTL